MTEKLREELARIGDAAPRVTVSGDVVWARGRRARRRDRVVVGAAVLSVVAMLGGLGVLFGLPGDSSEGVPIGEGVADGALPTTIHSIPHRRLSTNVDSAFLEVHWDHQVAETSLALGRASLAFQVGTSSLPVVVTAADGRYHLMDLEGWYGATVAGAMQRGGALALSPDGFQLAWGFYDSDTLDEPVVRSGIKIADLRTGRVRTVVVDGGRGTTADIIRWSPDSRWIAWSGRQARGWERELFTAGRAVAGRVAPGQTSNEPIPVTSRVPGPHAIDADGLVGQVRGEDWWTFGTDRRGEVVRGVITGSGSAGAFSPDGSQVALGHGEDLLAHDVPFLVTRPEPSLMNHPIPERGQRDATIEPLGWISDDEALFLVAWFRDRPAELVVVSSPTMPGESFGEVTTVEGEVQELSVAVDLIGLDNKPRDFPEPEWPWSDERKWGTAALVVVPLVLLALVLRQRRRNGRLA